MDWILPLHPLAGSLPCFHFSTLALLYLLQAPGCTACASSENIVAGDTVQWFLSLKGDSTQMHSNPMSYFWQFLLDFGWRDFSRCGYITQEARRSREAVLMNRLMLILAKHSTSLDTWKDRPVMWDSTLPTQKDLLTNSRDLWPNWFYLLYFIFYFNKLRVLKNQNFKAVFQEHVVFFFFYPLYLFLLNRAE